MIFLLTVALCVLHQNPQNLGTGESCREKEYSHYFLHYLLLLADNTYLIISVIYYHLNFVLFALAYSNFLMNMLLGDSPNTSFDY